MNIICCKFFRQLHIDFRDARKTSRRGLFSLEVICTINSGSSFERPRTDQTHIAASMTNGMTAEFAV